MIVSKFFFGFMSLLIASIVENSRTLPGIYFIFLENILDQTWKSFNTIFGPQWKDPKSSFQKARFTTFLQVTYPKFRLKL